MKFVARILFIFNSRSLISFVAAGNDIYIADCYSDTDLSKNPNRSILSVNIFSFIF